MLDFWDRNGIEVFLYGPASSRKIITSTPQIPIIYLMMNLLSQCGNMDGIHTLIDDVIEQGLEISVRTLNILLTTCSLYGKYADKKYFKKFMDLNTKFNYKPYHDKYKAILQCVREAEQHKLVVWVFRLMYRAHQDIDTFIYNVVL